MVQGDINNLLEHGCPAHLPAAWCFRGLMDAQVQPHTMARTQHAPKGASEASKPGGSSSSAAGAPGQRVRNLLDHVLGDGVVPWSVEAGDDPTGLAAAAAAAGGVNVDADQMQQYGISQVWQPRGSCRTKWLCQDQAALLSAVRPCCLASSCSPC